MSDPLSIAASVAGLLALGGTVSKTTFQFLSSIADAPEQARHLVRELYALNVALAQVQGNLLDPKFVSSIETGSDEDVSRLHACLFNCTAVFSELETRVHDSCLAEQPSGSRSVCRSARRSWESIKWSFTDDKLRELLRRVEAAKTTLGLINGAFIAKLSADILGRLKDTETEVRKIHHRLKNVQVIVHWAVQQAFQQNTVHDPESLPQTAFPGNPSSDELLESSVFSASSTYEPTELAMLLQDNGSMLSLTLEKTPDDTIAVLWSPDGVTSSRSSAAAIRPGMPRTIRKLPNLFESTESGDLLRKLTESNVIRADRRRFSGYPILKAALAAPGLDPLSMVGLLATTLTKLSTAYTISTSLTIGDKYISDLAVLCGRVDAVHKALEHFPRTERLNEQRRIMDEACTAYADLLHSVLKKSDGRGFRGTIYLEEYDKRYETALEKVASFEASLNSLFIAETMEFQKETMKYQEEQRATSNSQTQKIDMLSERLSRIESDIPNDKVEGIRLPNGRIEV